MTPTPEKIEATKPKAISKTGWQKSKVHEGITLPSGAVVDISLPNIAALIKSGTIPNALVEAATQAQGTKVTKERILETWDYIEFIVPETVVSPKVTFDDVASLPIEDVEMIAAFASRTQDIDAVGHHLGGLETQKSFRRTRGLLSVDEIMESV